MSYDNEFELDLSKALLAQLPERFDAIKPSPLSKLDKVSIERDAQGAYLLYYEDELVYVGKSDAQEGLRKRLSRHHQRVQQRQGLIASEVAFKAVRIYSFSVIDIETLLISHYEKTSENSWNNSGFGSNDPGRRRDKQRPSKFDNKYPLKTDIPLSLKQYHGGPEITLSDAIKLLSGQIPFTFRAESVERQHHPDLISCKVDSGAFFGGTPTIEEMAERIVEVLASQSFPGWQFTLLKGYCILYKEYDEYKYQAPIRIFRS